jgi:hypothetical protein
MRHVLSLAVPVALICYYHSYYSVAHRCPYQKLHLSLLVWQDCAEP